MSDKNRRGLRCQVCTGCGRCPGTAPAGALGRLHVLAEDALRGERRPIPDWRAEGIEAVEKSSEIIRGAAEEMGVTGRDPKSPGSVCGTAEEMGVTGRDPKSPESVRRVAEGIEAGRRRLATVDLGTTTIAMLLYNADGTVADRFVSINPQVVYGADVISRISAGADERTAGDMRRQATAVLERGLSGFREQLAEGESLLVVLAANTTMNYLLTGRDTSELGCAPFRASSLWETDAKIAGIPSFLFPGLSAFVGGDIAAGMLACGMDEGEGITLLVDLGTNGEIVLGNRERRVACATAAGSAFEGGVNRGVWGSDMISLLATLRRERILDETGLLEERYFEGGIRIGNVCVTQEAVRSVQLAKAAVAAGIEILLKKYGITSRQVERVVLAGGFGYYLDPEAVAEIGLFSDVLAQKAVAGGNTALSGALLAGREILGAPDGRRRLLKRLRRLAEGTECVNLASEPEFSECYIRRMELTKK